MPAGSVGNGSETGSHGAWGIDAEREKLARAASSERRRVRRALSGEMRRVAIMERQQRLVERDLEDERDRQEKQRRRLQELSLKRYQQDMKKKEEAEHRERTEREAARRRNVRSVEFLKDVKQKKDELHEKRLPQHGTPLQLERQKRIEMHQSEAARLMKGRQDAVSEQISRKDEHVETLQSERQKLWQTRRTVQLETRRSLELVRSEVAKQEVSAKFTTEKLVQEADKQMQALGSLAYGWVP